MFNHLNNHSETKTPIWDTVFIIITSITVSALIFSITAATSMTNPQPDHVSALFLHDTNQALLTLGLAALPLMIYALVLGHSTSSSEAR